MNDWEAKTLDVQFKNFVPKALIETLKHQHNTCIGRRTYMKLANAIGKKILGLNKLEDYSISQEDILNDSDNSKSDLFLRFWTSKESFAKMLGTGIFKEIKSISFADYIKQFCFYVPEKRCFFE